LILLILGLAPALKAGFPLIVDDSGTDAVGDREVEFDLLGLRQKGFESLTAEFSFTAGLNSWMEGSLTYSYAWERERQASGLLNGLQGFGDLSFGLKGELLDSEKAPVGLALSASATLPVADGIEGVDGTNLGLVAIITRDWTKNFSTDFNVGFNAAARHGLAADAEDAVFVGVALRWTVTTQWMLFAETYADLPTHPSGQAQQIVRGGIQYDFGHNLLAAVALSAGYGETHSTGLTFGINKVF